MRSNINYSYLLIMVSIFCILGCQSKSHVTDGYYYGVLFNAIETRSDLNQSQDDATFYALIQLTAPDNGVDIDEVEVLVAFDDEVYDAADKSKEPRLLEVIPNANFINNLNAIGRPEFEYSVSKQNLIEFLNLTQDDVNGGDAFEIIFKVTLENEVTFQHTERAEVVCTEETLPTAGEWSFTLQDDLSDSWDGAALKIIFDNEVRELTLESGDDEKTFTVDIPEGVSSFVIEYVAGVCCTDEHSLIIESSRGIIVFESDDLSEGALTDFDFCGF